MVFVALSDRVKRDKPLESVLFPVVEPGHAKTGPFHCRTVPKEGLAKPHTFL